MNRYKKFLICGGDLRQVKLCDKLVEDGFDVTLMGFDKKTTLLYNIPIKNNIDDFLSEADVIIFPLPVTIDGKTLNSPMCQKQFLIKDIFKKIKPNQVVCGGKISDEIINIANEKKIKIFDYLNREEFAISNAIPTAEGALQIAMAEMPITLHNAKALVMGYGKIGSILANDLKMLGAKVSCETTSFEHMAKIKANSLNGIFLEEINKYIGDFDVIFNTIPSVVLDYSLLKEINENTLIIDLASKPGGVDMESATMLGKKVIWALSLPGTVAPITASVIIKDTIFNILSELEANGNCS